MTGCLSVGGHGAQRSDGSVVGRCYTCARQPRDFRIVWQDRRYRWRYGEPGGGEMRLSRQKNFFSWYWIRWIEDGEAELSG